ncbi:MAG: TetR/AcrR family transcriptional regulator [Pseudomonadota bacterium]
MSKKPQTSRTGTPPKTHATRRKLVDAAHALIWASSYAHVSVEDICREAGVQKGSFYHFFPTKSDLAAAALEDHWQQIQPEMEAIFANHLSPQQQLRAVCRAILTKQQEAMLSTGKVCGCPYATVGSEMGGNNEALRQLAEQMTEHFSGYFERLLAHAARAGLIEKRGIAQRAREMHIYVMGATLQARITNSIDCVGKPLETALHRISGIPKSASRAK